MNKVNEQTTSVTTADRSVGGGYKPSGTAKREGQSEDQTAPKENKYIAYLRVSTKKQGAQGLGIEAQREVIRKHIQGSGGIILHEFIEVESGSNRSRPELIKAVAMSKTEKATLITAKLDRLARDTEFAMMVKNNAYDLVCCDIAGMNLFMFGIMALFAEYELKQIRGRIKAALQAKKAKGWRPKPSETFKVSGGHIAGGEVMKGRAMQFDYSTVSTIKDLKSKGKTYSEIAKILNDNHQKMPNGKTWHSVAIHRLIKKQSS